MKKRIDVFWRFVKAFAFDDFLTDAKQRNLPKLN